MRSLQFSSHSPTYRVPSFRLAVLGVTLLLSFSACGPYDPNFGGPYGGGYNGGYNGGYYNDGFETRRDIERSRQERRELERERERAQTERERLERERENSYSGYKSPPPPPSRPAPQVDRCPPGFSPSERKCSSDERRQGCRDIRTPSGLGCVSR
jgi:hypothetical protein